MLLATNHSHLSYREPYAERIDVLDRRIEETSAVACPTIPQLIGNIVIIGAQEFHKGLVVARAVLHGAVRFE